MRSLKGADARPQFRLVVFRILNLHSSRYRGHHRARMPPVTIHQPAPCHENWEAMTPTDVGRHCAACQTQVVDFTRMTDDEVVAYLRHTTPGRRCGRFREDQVGRPLLAAARPVTGRRRWATAAVLLLGSVFGLKARAQEPGPNARAMAPAGTRPVDSDSLLLVYGVVRNRWGVRKEGVRVRMGSVWETTDAHGRFRLLLPKRSLVTSGFLIAIYRNPRNDARRLTAEAPFDRTA